MNPEDLLASVSLMRSQLEQDVLDKKQILAEAEERLSCFRANTLSAIGAASGSKSAQKQRAERQAVVADMLAAGLTRAEIVRRTGINDHLVGYDIDCVRKHRIKQGTKKVMRTDPQISAAAAAAPALLLKSETAPPAPAPTPTPAPAPAPVSAPVPAPVSDG
jgi:transposase-like protein